MNRLEGALRRAAADLNRRGRMWALVGGFAVSARAVPRFTRDVDIAVGHLIALKLLARDDEMRPQDQADLLALCQVATPLDIEAARAGVQLITNRGFNRDRDLMGALDAMTESGERP